MKILTASDYNTPRTISGSLFGGPSVPSYSDYLGNYYVHFLRYLYYMCAMGGDKEYPDRLSVEELVAKLTTLENCRPTIRKVLIGEAPPANATNYFYNPDPSSWNVKKGAPAKGGSWARQIQTALFGAKSHFPSKQEFLQACAKEGFLLLDLFPYAISFSSSIAKTKKYYGAVNDAFGFGGYSGYPSSIKATLDSIECCIDSSMIIGFSLIRFGNRILDDKGITTSFLTWFTSKGRSFPGSISSIDQLRIPPVKGASIYVNVFGKQGPAFPLASLMKSAGF